MGWDKSAHLDFGSLNICRLYIFNQSLSGKWLARFSYQGRSMMEKGNSNECVVTVEGHNIIQNESLEMYYEGME